MHSVLTWRWSNKLTYNTYIILYKCLQCIARLRGAGQTSLLIIHILYTCLQCIARLRGAGQTSLLGGNNAAEMWGCCFLVSMYVCVMYICACIYMPGCTYACMNVILFCIMRIIQYFILSEVYNMLHYH